jgi:hypothetical protein
VIVISLLGRPSIELFQNFLGSLIPNAETVKKRPE